MHRTHWPKATRRYWPSFCLCASIIVTPLELTPQRKKEKTFEALLRQFAGRVIIAIGDYPAAASHLERAVRLYRAEKNWMFDPRLGADTGSPRSPPGDCYSGTKATLIRRARWSTRHSSEHGNSPTSTPSHMHFTSPVWAALSARKTAETEELGDELVGPLG